MNGRMRLPRSRHQIILNESGNSGMPHRSTAEPVAERRLKGVSVRIAILPALVAAALAVYPADDALASSKHKPVHTPAAVAPSPQPPRAAAYEADGTPIATGEP